MKYIHERKDWPIFRWDRNRVGDRLVAVRHHQGRLIGRMDAMGFALREEAVLNTLTEDVLKSSEIEGDILDKSEVRSSIARRLGMNVGGLTSADRHVEGVVEMMLDATQNFQTPLTSDRLFAWHAALFPAGHAGMQKMTVGGWRDDRAGPMQVVSGPLGRERVHYQAPAADRLDDEMHAFLTWFNEPESLDGVLKAGIAHFWFVTIHPFDDGNGRIARAMADMALARSEGSPRRFYSMSAQIRHERGAYYDILETVQKADVEITDWLDWFLGCLDRAFAGAEAILANVLAKAEFWERHRAESLNDRQRYMLSRLLEGFQGKLTSSKWATINHCSQDTAFRDIDDLIDRGLLVRDPAGGRSTSYSLAATP